MMAPEQPEPLTVSVAYDRDELAAKLQKPPVAEAPAKLSRLSGMRRDHRVATVVFFGKVFGPAVVFGVCLWWVTSR